MFTTLVDLHIYKSESADWMDTHNIILINRQILTKESLLSRGTNSWKI